MAAAEKNHLEPLIKGCIKGDRKCQYQMYEMLYGKMMSTCLRYIVDREEAKDVLQESLLKVFNNLQKYDNTGSFEGWVKRVVVNNCIDFLRKRKDLQVLVDQEFIINNFSGIPDEPEENLMDLDLKPEKIMEALQYLSPVYRTIFNLHVIEGLSHQQIAEKLGINIGTSKSNLSKARQNLKKLLLKEQRPILT